MTTGTSSRLSYDTSAYESDIGQSTSQLKYLLEPVYAQNCGRCYPEVGQSFPARTKRDTDPRIDIENTLTSRKWKRDKRQVNGEKWDDFNELQIKYGGDEELPECMPGTIETRHTLLTDPKITSKSKTIEHLVFSTLPINAQDYIPVLRNPGISSRDIAIAEYRKIKGSSPS